MPAITSGFEARVTNVFSKRSCVAFQIREGAIVVEGSSLLFVNGKYYEHRQAARSVQINHRPVKVVAAGEKCAILVDDHFDGLPPNNSEVFLIEGIPAQIGGIGTVFRVFDQKNVIGVLLENGALCEGDWIIVRGADGYRHEQVATSIEVSGTKHPAVEANKRMGILLEDVDPVIGLPEAGATVTVVSIKQ